MEQEKFVTKLKILSSHFTIKVHLLVDFNVEHVKMENTVDSSFIMPTVEEIVSSEYIHSFFVGSSYPKSTSHAKTQCRLCGSH